MSTVKSPDGETLVDHVFSHTPRLRLQQRHEKMINVVWECNSLDIMECVRIDENVVKVMQTAF